MAQINFGGVLENVVTREEFSLDMAREVLKSETVAVIGYGVQGPGQSLNLKDNGINVIIGQRKGGKSWEKALADGWIENKNLFEIEEACNHCAIFTFRCRTNCFLAFDKTTFNSRKSIVFFSWIRHNFS